MGTGEKMGTFVEYFFCGIKVLNEHPTFAFYVVGNWERISGVRAIPIFSSKQFVRTTTSVLNLINLSWQL